jgi:EAL domain-containing protein (putative c-di-GMP-specific phosphodiesterase class I)
LTILALAIPLLLISSAFPSIPSKIDRSFIGDISDDNNDAGITKAIIAMAHTYHEGALVS